MNKERLGNFIGDERKALGLTQKDLAARLHVTDKAVSKWERGLSYPDVTLLEPLAEALDLGVEELMACRKQAVREKKEDDSVKNLLTISGDNLRAERSRSRKKLAVLAVLLLAAVVGLVWFCLRAFSNEQGEFSIEWKETVDGVNYIYIEREGQLLRLKCGREIDFDGIEQTNEYGNPREFLLDYRYNKRTYQGVVKSCEATGTLALGSLGDMIGSMMGLDTMPGMDDELFGFPCVFYEYKNAYLNPYGKGEIYSFRFWSCDPETWENEKLLLTVDDCFGFTNEDYDNDGVTELIVRTRWALKPYILYDIVDGEMVETWLDTVEPELAERLMTAAELQEQLDREIALGLAKANG